MRHSRTRLSMMRGTYSSHGLTVEVELPSSKLINCMPGVSTMRARSACYLFRRAVIVLWVLQLVIARIRADKLDQRRKHQCSAIQFTARVYHTSAARVFPSSIRKSLAARQGYSIKTQDYHWKRDCSVSVQWPLIRCCTKILYGTQTSSPRIPNNLRG